MKKKITLFFLLFSTLIWIGPGEKVFAQDIHFSQFYNCPLLVNPANTGVFAGRYRFATQYKNQWQSVSNAYKTVFAGCDVSLLSKKLGVGLTFLNDKAGKSKMGTTQGNLSLSYDLQVTASNHIFAGLQYGIGQRSIHVDDLKWDSQFNGSAYDPSIASGEPTYSDAYLFMDVGAGIMWNYTAKHSHSKFRTSAGVAAFHLNQPQLSYYTNEKLNYKIVGHFNCQYELPKSDIYILPQLLYMHQGTYNEINIGTLVKFAVGAEAGDLIGTNKVDRRYSTHFAYLGGQLRYKDALTLMAAFELRAGLMFSASYDINISKLRTASQFRGGPEISLIFRGYFNND